MQNDILIDIQNENKKLKKNIISFLWYIKRIFNYERIYAFSE